jgi:hypothetical protein
MHVQLEGGDTQGLRLRCACTKLLLLLLLLLLLRMLHASFTNGLHHRDSHRLSLLSMLLLLLLPPCRTSTATCSVTGAPVLDLKGPSLQHPLGGYLSRPRFSWLAAVAADAGAAALQDQYSNMLIYWRPDLGLYRAVITEAVPANTPFDPPFINPTLTPIGGFVKPASDANNKQTGQLMAGIHLVYTWLLRKLLQACARCLEPLSWTQASLVGC